MADETTQGVHPFTVGWWNRLPNVYRRADRAQGFRLNDAWHGLNRDPRFITGDDGWHKTNTSTDPWVAAVSFTRTFHATPNVPVHIRTWHHPMLYNGAGQAIAYLAGTRVRHVIRNHTNNIVADEWNTENSQESAAVIVDAGQVVVGDEAIYDGGTPSNAPPEGDTAPEPEQPGDRIDHHTVVTPDRFGVVQVTVHIHLDVTDLDLDDDVRIGPGDILEAIHVGTQDVTFSQLPAADYFATAAAYPLLRFMDGIGHQAGYISDMANDMHAGAYTDPLTAPESSLRFLAAVMGVPTRYSNRLTPAQLRQHLVDMIEGNSPTPGSRNHIAITAKQWLTGTKDVSVTPAHDVDGYTGADPTHTLIVSARANEIPEGMTLADFAQFLNDAGVIPAGHRVITREGNPTWDQWEAATGPTWDDLESKIRTWNDSDSAGLALGDQGA